MIVFRDQRIPFFFFWITFLLPGSAPGQLFSSRDTAVANAHPWKRETGSSVLDSSTCAKTVVFSSLRGVDMYKNLFLVGVFKCKKTVLAAGHAVWWSLRIVYFHLFGKTVFPKKMGKKSGGATNNVCVLPLHQSKKLCFKKLFQAAAVVIVGASAFLHTRHFTPVSSSFFLFSLFFIFLWSLFPLRSPANWPCMNAAFHCAYTRVFFFFFRSLIFSSVLTRVFFLFVCLF